MLLSFERPQEGQGLEIVDHVERRQCTLRTPEPVEPKQADVEEFRFPVDRGVAFEAESVTIPHRMIVLIRNSMGLQIQELSKGESCELPADRYSIEMTAPVKVYLVVESEVSAKVSANMVQLDFGRKAEISVGIRSYHKNPAASITTTEKPEDMMAAVSMLSSALKATSPERSYPTLRGHPPTIELGDKLEIPDILEKPDTGVRIEIPPELRFVFVVSPLAYYLGADIVPGPVPRIVGDNGFEQKLEDPARGFEGEVERVLKQVFFLDCLTRTEGFYPVNLHERNALEEDLDLDFASLYDASMSEQLAAYLDIPFGVIEPELPEWNLTARVAMVPGNVEMLPFVINDLAIIRSPDAKRLGNTAKATGGSEFSRAGEFTRSSASDGRASVQSAPSPPLIRPAETDSLEQVWVGEGAPVGASKAMVQAFRNRLNRQPVEGDIDITVVCNDSAMNNERNIVDDIYGSREELPFDVRGYHELSVEEFRAVLKQDCHLLHYIGHIDERGFECADGYLDAQKLESTGVEAFLLNACTSYQQGMQLIRAGSIAGVVTVEDVINSGAERIGSSLAKLLNHGFPFSAALDIARDESIVGGNYLILGDGSIDIAQSESGVPGLSQLSVGDKNVLTYRTYLTFDKGLGTITIPHAGENSEFYLSGGENGQFELDDEELVEFLEIETQPIVVNEKLYWTDEEEMAELINTI